METQLFNDEEWGILPPPLTFQCYTSLRAHVRVSCLVRPDAVYSIQSFQIGMISLLFWLHSFPLALPLEVCKLAAPRPLFLLHMLVLSHHIVAPVNRWSRCCYCYHICVCGGHISIVVGLCCPLSSELHLEHPCKLQLENPYKPQLEKVSLCHGLVSPIPP